MSPVFFRGAVVGKDLFDESGTDLEAPLDECLGDLIHITIGLEALTDDERFEFLGAF